MTLRSIWVLTGSNSCHNRVAYFGRSNRHHKEVLEKEAATQQQPQMCRWQTLRSWGEKTLREGSAQEQIPAPPWQRRKKLFLGLVTAAPLPSAAAITAPARRGEQCAPPPLGKAVKRLGRTVVDLFPCTCGLLLV